MAPPGVWSSPQEGVNHKEDQAGTNDALDPGQRVSPSERPSWNSWDEVPRDAHRVAALGPWFLEIFSGTAHLTQAVKAVGVPCLPPIDVVLCDMVPTEFDVVDVNRWIFIMQLVMLGAIFFVHCGTPCNTFSSARKEDGGPPPLRSGQCPLGLHNLSLDNEALVWLGNLFVFRTVEVCLGVSLMGGEFSSENPLFSLIWSVPQILELKQQARAFDIDFDQCAFGAPSRKPTRLLTSAQQFQRLCKQCPGDHKHVQLKGKVWSTQFGRWVYRTKLAQVYPEALCSEMARVIKLRMVDPLVHLTPSFQLCSSPHGRKRPLGQSVRWDGHRQARSALAAVASGYQLKRGALKPLLTVECHPGEAIAWAMSIPHPFSVDAPLDEALAKNINAVTRAPQTVVAQRRALLDKWGKIAACSLIETDVLLRQVADPHLRRLLRGVPDDQLARLGVTCNVVLYARMLDEVKSVDLSLPSSLMQGLPIVGAIERSGRWPPYEKPQQVVSLDQLGRRAWELRKKIIHRVQAVPCSENLKKIWDSTMEDVEECSCLGPFENESEVSEQLGRDDWIPTQRFEVVQKNKVRGCDSATTNLINPATEIVEKLQLPSTDSNVAALRKLRSEAPWCSLAGWVLDERKAFRQVAVKPDHRRFSVICVKDPSSGKPSFFIMVGHSFGLVSAVYNYNRRSAAINEFLVSLFGLVAFSFYDDKYGFEPVETVQSAHEVAQAVHFWLGARFDQKKLQLSRQPVILGVTYDLESMVLLIKEDRKKELVEEIDSILASRLLDPGLAGKLKGKLMFGASQLWGKVGRAFLRVISERQYARHAPEEGFALDDQLVVALQHWRELVRSGPPRPIELRRDRSADVVIFTDGFTPDPRTTDKSPDRVGAVLFDRRLTRPLQFSEVIPKSVQKEWLSRKTQIVPVEMIAPILSLKTFSDRLQNVDVILLIDSEAVEASLIKGYSSKEDLCKLISLFWDLIFDLRARVFIDRIATDANPADWPSRDDLITGEKAGWATVKAVWPKSLCQ